MDCGGRGRGAAADAVKSSPRRRAWSAIGDAFADRVAETRERLKELGEAGMVPEERAYVGLDAYQKVIATPGVELRDPGDAARASARRTWPRRAWC